MDSVSISNLPLLPKKCGTAFVSFMSLNDRTLMRTIISKSFTLESGMNASLCLIILGHF